MRFKVFHELLDALHNARCDDSHVLLLTGSGNVFCSGIDLHYLLTECCDRRMAAKTMADCLRLVDLALIVVILRFCYCYFQMLLSPHLVISDSN